MDIYSLQDKVKNADSALIFLIIFLISSNGQCGQVGQFGQDASNGYGGHWSGWSMTTGHGGELCKSPNDKLVSW